MKVLIVSHYLTPGGLSVLLENQLQALEADGVECLLVGPPPIDERLTRNFSVFNLDIPPSVKNLYTMTRAAAKLRQIIKAFMPDVVVAHGFRACLATALVPSGATKVFVNHGDVVKGILRGFVIRALALVPLYAITNFPIWNSRWNYSPFLSPAILNSEPMSMRQTRSTFQDKPLRIGWFARVDKPKRPDIWLQIIKGFVSHVGGGEGVFIGNIEALDKRLDAEIRDAQIVRTQPWTSLKEAMKQMDVLVAWSDAEGQLPLAAQEAIWHGVPVLTNRLPGIAAFLGQDAQGIVNDQNGAIQELRRLIYPEARRELLVEQQIRLGEHRENPDLTALIRDITKEVVRG
jgi:glycosyltransferase involved in cell wall biosynthesis